MWKLSIRLGSKRSSDWLGLVEGGIVECMAVFVEDIWRIQSSTFCMGLSSYIDWSVGDARAGRVSV